MLIAINGSQGVGKSTIVSKLSTLGYNTIDRKTSRSIQIEWGLNLQEIVQSNKMVEFQHALVKRKLDDEMHAHHSTEVFFTERSFTDLFIYGMITLGNDNAHSDFIDEYYDTCKKHQQSYDAVFYLKGGHFSVTQDGVRGHNKHYGTLVDISMLHFTQTMTLPEKLNIVDASSVDDRVKIITTKLQEIVQC